MIAERFSYENDLDIKVGMTQNLMTLILGNPKYSSGYFVSGITPEGIQIMNFSLVFETKSELDIQITFNAETRRIVNIMYGVPRLNLNPLMDKDDVFDVLGEGTLIGIFPIYLWHFDDLDFIAEFAPGTGKMYEAYFKECEGHEENA